MKKSTKSIVIFGSLFIFSTTIFAMYISQKLNKEPYVEEKRIYKIDTVKNDSLIESNRLYKEQQAKDLIEFNRVYNEQQAKKENERMQKEYEEKVLKEQIENDKKEMEYLNKRYLEPYKKK